MQGCLSKPLTSDKLFECLRGLGDVRDVLIIDDDRGFVQLVTRYLASDDGDYTVRWAHEGEEALARIQAKCPDVILLDLIMPGMDGFQLLDVLRSDEALSSIPVFLVTATNYSQDMLDQRGAMIGLTRPKGFGVIEVISYLRAILDKSDSEYLDDTVRVPLAALTG